MKKFLVLLVGISFIVFAGLSYAATKNHGKCACKKACPNSCSCRACTCAR